MGLTLKELVEGINETGRKVEYIIIGGETDYVDEWLATHGDKEIKTWNVTEWSKGAIEVELKADKKDSLEGKFEEELLEQIKEYGYIDAQIIQRFNFEPRSDIHNHKWIVIWDRFSGGYVKEEGSKKAYKRFDDFEKALRWLRSRYHEDSGKHCVVLDE